MNLVIAEVLKTNHPYAEGEEFRGYIQLITGCDKVSIFQNSPFNESPKYLVFDSMDKLLEFMAIKTIVINNGPSANSPASIKNHIDARLKFRDQSINYSKSKQIN